MKAIITVKDEIWCYITGLMPTHVTTLWNEFGVYVDGYFFMPAYKMGNFDGKIRFFDKHGYETTVHRYKIQYPIQ